MNTNTKARIAIAALMAVALVCVIAAGVVVSSSAALAAPQTPAPQPRMMRYHGTVVTANGAAIILRNPNNPRDEMTFSYSPCAT